MNKNQQSLATQGVAKLMRSYAVPCVISFTGRGAVQHCRPNFYCECQLPWLLRQCRQHSCFSAYGYCAGTCGNVRRRLLRFCKPFAGGTKQQKRDPQRWQFGNPLPGCRHYFNRCLPNFCRADFNGVWRKS